jgi:uncharacterized protein involved in exopolysaccharide biosynthesis
MYRNVPILYRVLESFFRYRNLFLICAVIITVIPGAFLMTRKTTYSSTGMIQMVVEDFSPALGASNKSFSWVSVAQQNTNRFNEWMNDDSPGGFVDLALQKAHLSRSINPDPRAKDPRLAQLRKGLTVNTASDTVFAINLVWDNLAECEQLVQALQSEYIERTGHDKQAQSVAIVQFLDGELETYAGRLRAAEQVVIDFKRNNAGQSPEAQSATMDQLSQLKIQLNELEISSHNTDLTREAIQKRISQIKPTSIMEQHIMDGPVRDNPLFTQVNELQAKRNSLIADGWLPTSTRVTVLNTQIDNLKQELIAAAKADPAGTRKTTELVLQDNPEYRDLQRQLTESVINGNTQQSQIVMLRQRIGEYETRIARLPQAEARLNDRMRDFNTLKTQYEDLLKRREQARLQTNLDKLAATSTLHGIGTVYAQATGGKAKTLVLFAGLSVLGLAIGLSVTFLAEWADPSVRFVSDIPRRLGVPALISLPELAPLKLVTSSPESEMSGGRPLLPARNE